ncbi:MAG TPA: hypothetical protein VMI92_02680 [Steroidobacteraceae bacterium]|nr:hypothetical protein [Steroidobacteraceae bacterium]
MRQSCLLTCATITALLTAGAASGRELAIAEARALCASGDVGGRTPFGETAQESANKKVAFDWACLTFVEHKPREAFARYVARDFCDHSHMSNGSGAACTNYEDSIKLFSSMDGNSQHKGTLQFPDFSSANGELVTQWGPDADIYRVHDGKIVEHWDAAPPGTITLKAHDAAFSARMQRELDARLARNAAGGGNAAADAAKVPKP